MTHLRLSLSVIVLAGCATTTPQFNFASQQARSCFVPCDSYHDTCLDHCSHGGWATDLFRRKSALEEIAETVDTVVCHSQCNSALRRCASACGGWEQGQSRPRHAAAYQDPDTRQRELQRQMEAMKQTGHPAEEPGADRGCGALHRSLLELARGAPPPAAGEPVCPPLEKFVPFCNKLRPRTVRCLHPGELRRAKEQCQERFREEDPEAAARMNDVLRGCYEAIKRAGSIPRLSPAAGEERDEPTSQPASSPRGS